MVGICTVRNTILIRCNQVLRGSHNGGDICDSPLPRTPTAEGEEGVRWTNGTMITALNQNLNPTT